MCATRRFRGVVAVALFLLTLASTATAKYNGGTGEPNDPYQIATAADLIALGETPEDYSEHFILTADIDLDPNLPGRKVFGKAVIAPDAEPNPYSNFQGTPFTGVFDGDGHTISHLTISGGRYLGLFGRLESGAEVKDLGVVDVNVIASGYSVGGLVGENDGTLTQCYSTGAVSGTGQWSSGIGGLVGANGSDYGSSTVTQCYSTGAVTGQYGVGGLVGDNWGTVTQCYSTGAVDGNDCVGGLVAGNGGIVTECYSTGPVKGNNVGGLVGCEDWVECRNTLCRPEHGIVTDCFWDIQTSGQSTSRGGTGVTTAQMQTESTFSCWADDGVWTIAEGRDYPGLWWENAPGEPITRTYYYGGGSGTQGDPYLIYTSEQLSMIGIIACDWDKHFKLMADIDLSGFDGKEGRPAFNVIARCSMYAMSEGGYVFDGAVFAGVFDGNCHSISHLTVRTWGWGGLFGGLGSGGQVKNLGMIDVDITSSGDAIGGLVGWNDGGAVTQCYSTGAVDGHDYVGGVVGRNLGGSVTECYSTGAVGGGWVVGGLVGDSYGTLTDCYSAGAVTGQYSVGGLVGFGRDAVASFWDTQTSGQLSWSGIAGGKTTAEMQTASTFLNAGWDFVGETANGTEDTWWILEGKDYPRFVWERGQARLRCPQDGAPDVVQPLVVRWQPGGMALQHDVYFGEDERAVTSATTATIGVYRGRQPTEETAYDPGTLQWGKTYYWRIDEVNERDPNSPWKGSVWTFSTSDFPVIVVVDDFESYTDDQGAGRAIFQTWLDGFRCTECKPEIQGNGTGSTVGYDYPPFAEQSIVHDGKQSMPMDYNNMNEAWYSEADRTWETPQDWTTGGADTLTLYFRGEASNGLDPLYVGIEDSAGRVAAVVHPDADAVLATQWQKWHIALGELRAPGVDVAAVKKMVIGVGDRKNPKRGGTGRIYIDDIRLTKRTP